jgi:hypothetical protein
MQGVPGANIPGFDASGAAVPKQSAQSWATSQPDVAAGVPRPSKGPVVAVAVVGALVVLGGGAFAGFKLVGGSSKTETTQAVITAEPAVPKAAAAESPKAVEPPPAPPAPETKPVEAKPNDTAPSAGEVRPPIQPSAVPPQPKIVAAPVAPKARPLQAPPAPKPGAPAPKPAKQGTPDFGY